MSGKRMVVNERKIDNPDIGAFLDLVSRFRRDFHLAACTDGTPRFCLP